GLVKIDLLGNRSLAVIRDTLERARARGDAAPDYAALDATSDPRCQAMLARGESMGCFYVESPAMRQLQRRSGCGDFERLVIHSSIIRPAANEFIRTYLDRLHGKPWAPVHPELERLLQGTFGLMAYQEDVARIAIHLAGFSPHEADRLRKVLAKKTHDYRLADVEARFRAGVRQRGVGPALEESLWRMLESFAGYSFCKAHSASYALVSFKCCWLRDRYPAEFLAAVISNGGGYYSTLGYLGEARRLGITPELACVNESDWAWRGSGPKLRVGLAQLRGFRRVAGEALLRAREAGGRFQSFEDLVTRVPELERDELTTLARAGALDALPDAANRARLHWRIRLLGGRGPAGALFRDTARPLDPEPPQVPDLDEALRLEHELLAYGIPIRAHPLRLWSPELDGLDAVPAAELERHVGRRVRVCGWLVTAKLVHTKQKDAMEFVTLEDTTGLIEVTVFPRTYARGAWDLHAPRPVVIEGRVEAEHGVPGLIATRIESWRGPCRIAEPRFSTAADRVEEELLGA
ncbi:MAG: DNA polymerase III subunit alpha, partial [Planctomycetota bacterium]